jgi:hypothetical protein
MPTIPLSTRFAERDQSPTTALAVLEEIHASVKRSQKALLATDLAAIDEGTREQLLLVRELERHLGFSPATSLSIYPSELLASLKLEAERILELTRIQIALLARAERLLRVRANQLAGSSEPYAPVLLEQNAFLDSLPHV